MSEPSLSHPDMTISPQTIIASAPEAMDKPRRGVLRRVLRPLVRILTAQYALVLLAGICAVGAVRALLLPQILANFEAIATALKRTPL
jgi:hypothetical protein